MATSRKIGILLAALTMLGGCMAQGADQLGGVDKAEGDDMCVDKFDQYMVGIQGLKADAGAVGFLSGFVLHTCNAEWKSQLEGMITARAIEMVSNAAQIEEVMSLEDARDAAKIEIYTTVVADRLLGPIVYTTQVAASLGECYSEQANDGIYDADLTNEVDTAVRTKLDELTDVGHGLCAEMAGLPTGADVSDDAYGMMDAIACGQTHAAVNFMHCSGEVEHMALSLVNLFLLPEVSPTEMTLSEGLEGSELATAWGEAAAGFCGALIENTKDSVVGENSATRAFWNSTCREMAAVTFRNMPEQMAAGSLASDEVWTYLGLTPAGETMQQVDEAMSIEE